MQYVTVDLVDTFKDNTYLEKSIDQAQKSKNNP